MKKQNHEVNKMKLRIFLLGFLMTASLAHAQDVPEGRAAMRAESRSAAVDLRGPLTAQERERIAAFKELVRDVDTKSLQQTVREIESAEYPRIEFYMQEAIARTYADIVLQEKVVDQKQKEWLLSMVMINMASLQFGSSKDQSGNDLNRLIRRKLKSYMPPEILTHPGFLQVLE
ncbi:MAG TPA: hypothetical protein P5160_09240 [Candidatus Omnitrophota bacterium]|nr:hypothetical protein [Candidatus Omnitrophota bacterium]